MCPMCYINAIIFLIFGSSAAAIANSPWVIGIGVTLTVIGVLFLVQGYRRNKGQGGLKRNALTTVAVLLAFASGYFMAAFQTHDYFKERTHHNGSMNEEECESCDMMSEGKSKEEMMLMENMNPLPMNPLNNMNELSTTIKKAIEINKESSDMKADMRAELMKHATVTDEVMCECPYHEQLEKEKAEDSNMNVK